MSSKLLLLVIFVITYDYIEVNSFNLSPVPNRILKEPKLITQIPKLRGSYFGYSIVLRESSVIIAAPRAQSTLKLQYQTNETGAVYKCSHPSSSADTETPCVLFTFDGRPKVYNRLKSSIPDHQWLGATMDGSGKDTDYLLVCAPRYSGGYDRNNKIDYMHGICYWSKDTLGANPNMGRNSTKNPILQRLLIGGTYSYNIAQSGFSGHITANNEEFIVGAPGIDWWTGSVIRFNTKTSVTNIPRIAFDYMAYGGYAVASGYLDKDDIDGILYLATFPHRKEATQMGAADIFSLDANNSVETMATLHGTQFGEFFGYAALVVDVNGDGADDVLISAPMRSDSGLADVGAVHIFLNQGKFQFKKQLIESPFLAGGRFGTTMSIMGDINLDGYKDIAIGAPFANNHGSVAIYLGGPHGLYRTPCQILNITTTQLENITADLESASMFGHGLSKGVDIDRNDFTDLAVGAPGAETVFIYRAYPVVKIIASIKSKMAKLDLKARELQFDVCYQMLSNSTKVKEVELKLSMMVDSKIRRVILNRKDTINNHTLVANVKANGKSNCQLYKAEINVIDKYLFVPIELELSYELLHDGSQSRKQEFCEKCVVIDPKNERTSRDSITFNTSCKGNVCRENLKVQRIEGLDRFDVGSSNVLYGKYQIDNLGEYAFDAQVTFTTSINLPFAKVPPYCVETFDVTAKLVCHLVKGQPFVGRALLEVAWDVSKVVESNNFIVNVQASSAGEEQDREDNTIENVILFKRYSSIEIMGAPNITFTPLESPTEGKANTLSYHFEIKNYGPSPACHAELHIGLPVTYRFNEKRAIDFVNISSIQFETLSLADIRKVEREHYQSSAILNTQIDLPQPRTNVLDCHLNKNLTCMEIRVILPFILPEANFTLKLLYEVDADAIEAVMGTAIDYLGIVPYVAKSEQNEYDLISKCLPTMIVHIKPPNTPLWIYLISALGGLLILLLMAWVMAKGGFFKRQTEDEMKEAVLKKVGIARMTSQTEQQ